LTNSNQETLRVMEAMKETNDRRMFERYKVIHLHLKGYKQKDISEIILRSDKTVSSYIKAYREADWMGLNVDCQQVHPES
jgi:transposase